MAVSAQMRVKSQQHSPPSGLCICLHPKTWTHGPSNTSNTSTSKSPTLPLSLISTSHLFPLSVICPSCVRLQRSTFPLPLLPLPLIFCPSRGRGLVLSCLSARLFYLSISKASVGRWWPPLRINPVSARRPSISLLSITSDPSSAHLSPTAHVKHRMKG